MIAPLPPSEAERLTALLEHRLLDTPPQEEFDALVRLAAHLCGVPIAAISFIDAQRQWFKSILGVDVTELPRDIALCTHTILQSDLLVVADTRTDPRFLDNPQVTGDPGVRFYAGAPLFSEDGHALGTLCVADMIPRHLTPAQEENLRMLAHLATGQLQASRRVAEREGLLAAKESLVAEQERLVTEQARLVQEQVRAEASLAQSHAALAESEERLRRLTDAAFEGISVSQNGVLVDASPAFAALFGYDSPTQMLGLVTKELATPASRALVAQKVSEGNEQPYEAAMGRRDGTTFQAELRGRMIQLGGRPARITAVRDITERRRQEAALRQSQARLAEAQRVAQIGSWEYNTETASNTWSDELFRLFGMAPAEGGPDSAAIIARCHPDDVPKLRALSVQSMQDCLPYELDIRILHVNGSVRWMHAIGRGERDVSGRVTRLFGTLMDITERRLAEERFHILFERSSDAHLLLGEEGIIDCNDAAVSLLRCSDKTQVLSLHPAVLSPEFQPDGRRSLEKCIEMDALAHQNGFHRFEWMHLRTDGIEFPVEVTLTPVTLAERPVLLLVWHDLTERKQAEKALRASHARLSESETRLRLALESGGLGSYDLDQTTLQFLEISDTYKAQFGLPPEAPLSPETVFAMFHPDDQPHMHAAVERSNREGTSWQAEHRVVWNDGSIHWSRAHGLPIYDEAEQPVRMIGVTQDITERKRAEEALHTSHEHLSESETRLRLALESGRLGSYELDPATGQYLGVSDTYKAQFGLACDAEFSLSTTISMIHPDDRAPMMEVIKQAVAEHRSFAVEHRVVWADGNIHWILGHGQPIYGADGQPARIIGVNHDITERKQAEEAVRTSHERLSASETRLRLALESGRLGTFEMDQATGQFLAVSDLYKSHFGLTPEAEFSLATLIGMVHPDDRPRVAEVAAKAKAEGHGFQAEHRIIWPDGSVHWISTHTISLNDEAGQSCRLIGVHEDITERKALEAERTRLAEREHAIAAQLQAALQPPLPASVPHLALAAYTCPALDEAEVGGDFYDCFALDQDLYALVIGDVSGKGLAAAQQLALIRNSLRMALYLCRTPAEVAARLNAIVTSHGLLVGFATAFVGVYHTATGELIYTSCAHEPGLIRRACGAVEEMETTGPSLGMDEDSTYDDRTVTLSAGDSLLLYTDGLSESGPSRRELLGTEGMRRLFGELPKDTILQAQAESLVAEVKSFAGGIFRDDVTVLLARCQ